jgi:hypothetical protein
MSAEGGPGKRGGKGRRERLGEFGYRLSRRYVVPARACCRAPRNEGPLKESDRWPPETLGTYDRET